MERMERKTQRPHGRAGSPPAAGIA